MKIPNKLYDILKYIALIALPAIGTFWMVVGAIWGAPHTDEVVKTIVALGTLLGALLVLTNVQYNASSDKYGGRLDVLVTPNGFENYVQHLEVDGATSEATLKRGEVLLKVKGYDNPEDVPGA